VTALRARSAAVLAIIREVLCMMALGLPSASPQPLVGLDGLCEPFSRGFGLSKGSVEKPDAVGMGAHEADQGAVDRAGVGNREQIAEKPPT
jgi:hypothetical protein